MLYRLYSEQDDLLKGFLAKYIKATVIASVEEASNVDCENTDNYFSNNDIFIGSQTRLYLAEHEDDLSGSHVQEFLIVYKAVKLLFT